MPSQHIFIYFIYSFGCSFFNHSGIGLFQVLSDSTKKRDYDEQLTKEESKSVCQKSHVSSRQVSVVMLT